MIPLKLLADPKAILGIVISLIILSLPLIPKEEVETYYEDLELSYEQTPDVRLIEDTRWCFPQIRCSVTEAHQTIKNTDTITGKFYVNFIFDNGIEKKTNTVDVNIIPGEEKDVSVDVPLLGEVKVGVNVIPPIKKIEHHRTVTKYVNAWSILFPFD